MMVTMAMFLTPALITRAQSQNQLSPNPPQPELAPIPQTITSRTLANGVEIKSQPIPGVEYVVLIVQLKTGDNHDPADAPGLSQLLVDLAATAPVDTIEKSANSTASLNKEYPLGWNAQSHPDHTILAYVIPSSQLEDQIELAFTRIVKIHFTEEAVAHALQRMREDIDRRFRKEAQLAPMSWVTVQAFRHVSYPRYGISPDQLAKLSTDRLNTEWLTRTNPRNLRLFVCGDVAESSHPDIENAINKTFGSIGSAVDHAPDLKITVRPETGRERRRRVIVDKLPSKKEHVVVAFYSPDLTDPDHPAFLAVANEFMFAARTMPGAEARIPFQYSLLIDSRAAYLTPHIWRFPKGAGQALGFWLTKIYNKKFSNTDGRSTLRRLAWQLGEPLPSSLVAAINKEPALLYTIAYASALRENVGDSRFWESYRATLQRLKKDDLKNIRDKYFRSDDYKAIFVLTPPR